MLAVYRRHPLVPNRIVIPAVAGMACFNHWIPACAGMTVKAINTFWPSLTTFPALCYLACHGHGRE